MFAFAFYDSLGKKIILARDRFGKKPLYYTTVNNSLIFGSEIKSIIAMMDKKPEINKEAFSEYLTFLAPIAPNTIYSDVFALPGGSALFFNGNLPVITEYYNLIDSVSPSKIKSENEALEKLKTLIDSSISYRLVSDVPVATFLSGGIDSSLVSTLYSLRQDEPIHTFSIGYDSYKQYDELSFAQETAIKIGSIHHEITASKYDFDSVLDKVIYHLDEPVNDPACIPTYLLSESVRKSGIKVILSGEGSDEQFLGYDNYFKVLQNEGSEKIVFKTTGKNFKENEKNELINKSVFGKMISNESKLVNDFNKFSAKTKDMTLWYSYIDFKIWIQNVLNMKIDKNAMAMSLEARAPFLDHRMVELSMSIAPEIRKGTTNKYLLKKIAKPYISESIIERRKKGFSSPYLQWHYELHGKEILKKWQKLNSELGWFNNSFLEKLFAEGNDSRMRQHVWSLVIFEKWFNNIYK